MYIGAIDGTFIKIKAPSVDPESYNCRKKFYALQLQVNVLVRHYTLYLGIYWMSENKGINQSFNQVLQSYFLVGAKW